MDDDDEQVYISDVWGGMEALDDGSKAQDAEQHSETTPEAVQSSKKCPGKRGLSETLISEEQKLWAKLAEPPDISMTRIIVDDQEKLDELLADHSLNPADRCAMYKVHDRWLEYHIFEEHYLWLVNEKGLCHDTPTEVRFYEQYRQDIYEDLRHAFSAYFDP